MIVNRRESCYTETVFVLVSRPLCAFELDGEQYDSEPRASEIFCVPLSGICTIQGGQDHGGNG